MQDKENPLLTILRDRLTPTPTFRWAADNLIDQIAHRTLRKLADRQTFVQTPLAPTVGTLMAGDVQIVPIYRGGISMLDAFLRLFPCSPVFFMGLKRAKIQRQILDFYWHRPPESSDRVVILDPMLATADSAVRALEFLEEAKFPFEKIYFDGVIASQPGFDRLASYIPADHINVEAVDPGLDEDDYIVPGLGDWSDRYYGTPH